jgi:hypothetical protein
MMPLRVRPCNVPEQDSGIGSTLLEQKRKVVNKGQTVIHGYKHSEWILSD